MTYSIEEHKHRFAAWAAGSAASVNGCRFKVEQGKEILEAIGLQHLLTSPECLPPTDEIDSEHRRWRIGIIDAARPRGFCFTHGVAAKLINIYLKAGFACGGYHEHDRVCSLHPPVDSLLLEELYSQNVGGFRHVWNEARKARWSKFNSDQYEKVIKHIRLALRDDPLWTVEKYWRGFQ